MTDDNSFFARNLDIKKPYLQEEHKKVLKVIYDDACKDGAIQDFQISKIKTHNMKYTDIKEKTQIPKKILCICLIDLESMGFILKIMNNPNKEYTYTVSFLGVEYFKQLN